MSGDELEELALDTLYERKMVGPGCLVHNAGCRQLIDCGPQAMPAIERVLRDVVEPGLFEPSKYYYRRFAVTSLLGAYLVIAAKHAPEQAIAFIEHSSPSMMAKAICALRIFFMRRENGTYNSGVAPPPQFHAFLQRMAESPNDDLRREAIPALNQWAGNPGTPGIGGIEKCR
jgi:hypothetical protein